MASVRRPQLATRALCRLGGNHVTLICAILLGCMLADVTYVNVASAQTQRPNGPNWAALLGARAPQSTVTNAGSFNWTPPAQAAVGYVRTALCPTFSLNDLSASPYPSDVKTQVIDAVSLKTDQYRKHVPGLASDDGAAVGQAIEQACSPQRIAGYLLDWRYRLGGQVRRPPVYPPPPWQEGAPGILDRMPPALACYADDAAIGTFLSNVPLHDGNNGELKSVPEDWARSGAGTTLAQDTAQRFAPLCRAWYQQQFFAPHFERQHKLDAILGQYRQIFMAAAPDVRTRVVWETHPPAGTEVQQNSDGEDLERFYNELNIALQQKMRAARVASAPALPVKDEFEKTADYDARLQQAKEAALRDAAQLSAAEDTALGNARGQVFNSYFGVPVVNEATYDADREEMTLTVRSKTSPVRVTTVLHLTSDEARALKSQLPTAQPAILLTLSKGELNVAAVTVYSNWRIYQGRLLTFTTSPIAFTPAAAEQWPRTLAARAEDRRAQQALARQEEAAQIRREAATNPRLAMALNFPLARDPRCQAVWSNAINFARQPGVTEVTWNQMVDRLTDTLSKIRCLPGE